MGILSKKDKPAPLLRIVGNKPYATNADHEGPAPVMSMSKSSKRSASAMEDLNRDPDSDDEPVPGKGPLGYPKPEKQHVRAPRSRRTVVNIHGGSTENDAISTSPKKSQEKFRSSAAENDDENADGEIFSGSQSSTKRARRTYSKRTQKMNAVPEDAKASDTPTEKLSFKIPDGQNRVLGDASRSKPSLAMPGGLSGPPVQPSSPPKLFRRPIGMGEGSVPTSTQTSTLSVAAKSPNSIRSRSSSLSSTASLDLPELPGPRKLKSPTREEPESPTHDEQIEPATIPCPICGEQVDDTLMADFKIKQCHGKRMTFRLQELFCKTHQEQTHKKAWHERDYPEIDWVLLPERLKKHHKRIRDVLNGKVESYYQTEVEERVRRGKSKTAMQSWNNETESRPSVGYYGSRGQKIMANHIVDVFGKELRRRAGSDKVITAMGVSGGVSGYLQSVLVPEMALALVMEDAGCTAEEARRIVAESYEIGEALNEEEEEKVPQPTGVASWRGSDEDSE